MKQTTHDRIYASCNITHKQMHHFITRLPIEKKAKAAIKYFSKQADMNEHEFLYKMIKELTDELVHQWKLSLSKDVKKPIFFNNPKIKFLEHADYKISKSNQSRNI
jgi:hypothetical protein